MNEPKLIDFFLARRSVLANSLGEPGPSDDELQAILTAAARVPDHKKLAPWRFILFQGTAREKFGGLLTEICAENEENVGDARLETEKNRFLRAPVVIAVVSSPREKPGVPEWEQTLSAGAVCLSLLNAANALGFSGQWITEWYAYDPKIKIAVGLEDHEKIAGFIYIGTATEKPKERDRPDLAAIVSEWK